MRIALATDWFAPRMGGIEAQLEQLATRLAARGHDVDVLTTTPGACDGATFRVRRLDVLRLPAADVAISPRLPGIVARELGRGYDVVHAHVSVVSPLAYTATIVARSMRMPTVVTFHSVLRHKRHLLRLGRLLGGASRLDVSWSAVSGTVARQAQSALDADVRLLPNGTRLDFWRDATSPGGQTRDRIVLVSAGRLERKKRPLQLVRAFMEARRQTGVAAELIIAGEGSLRRALGHVIATAPDAGVRLLAWRDRDALRDLYRNADAFVMASEREAFGIAALEARAAGLPIIAMRAAGCADFLTHEHDALLSADDVDLEANIARFLVDADLRARLRSADTPLERYDWSAVISAHEQTYARALSSAGPTPGAASIR